MRPRLWAALAALLLLAGCAPAVEQAPASSSHPKDPSVHTDWSQLDEYRSPEPVETRWYEDYTDHLICRDDYGPLVPFIAQRFQVQADWGDTYTGFRWGLMTRDGTVVVDPVYSAVDRPSGEHGVSSDYLVLTRLFWDEAEQVYVPRRAMAAADGSWCTEFLFSGVAFPRPLYDGSLLALTEEGGLIVLEADGRERLHWTDEDVALRLPQWEFASCESLFWYLASCGPVLVLNTDFPYFLDGGTLEPLDFPSVTWALDYSQGLCAARLEDGGVGYLDTEGHWAIPPRYAAAESFRGGLALAEDAQGNTVLLDPAGNVLMQRPGAGSITLSPAGDEVYVQADGVWYDSGLEPLGWGLSFEAYGLAFGQTDDGQLVVKAGEGLLFFPLELGTPSQLAGDRILFSRPSEDGSSYESLLCDLEGNVLLVRDNLSFTGLDGDSPMVVSYQESGQLYWDLDGAPLFSGFSYVYPVEDGLFYVEDGWSRGCVTRSGQWLLRFLNSDMDD